VGQDKAGYRGGFYFCKSEYFYKGGLDRANHVDPAQQFAVLTHGSPLAA
jgi:hypothetical protein